jgi:hypothetical protein
MRVKKLWLAVAAVVALLGITASVALAMDRAEYVEAVEPICKINRDANDRILDGVRAEVKAGKLDQAAKKFSRAAKALKRTRLELLKVEQPPEDAARLTKWLKGVKTEAELFEAISRKLAHGERAGAQRMVARLVGNAKRTNNLVLEFEFHYCVFQVARYL